MWGFCGLDGTRTRSGSAGTVTGLMLRLQGITCLCQQPLKVFSVLFFQHFFSFQSFGSCVELFQVNHFPGALACCVTPQVIVVRC